MSLVDLAGLAGLRSGLAAHVKQDVRRLMVEAMGDQLFHAEIVAAGVVNFRQAFAKDMGAFFDGNRGKCDDLAEAVFAFIRQMWTQKYRYTPEFFLDKVEIPSPLTEAEIEAAWTLEIGSSESAMGTLYEGSARTRRGADLGERKVH